MTILLYKDGRLVIDDGNPIEGNSLEGLVACVSDPQSGDTLKFDGKQWVAGAAASGLPAVSGDDNGKVLTVVEGEWAPAAASGSSGLYIVEMVYHGEDPAILNKTAAEIISAYEDGKIIVLKGAFTNGTGGEMTQFVARNIAYQQSVETGCQFSLIDSTSEMNFVNDKNQTYSDYNFYPIEQVI